MPDEPSDSVSEVRTDLAIEARDVAVRRKGPPEIPGVRVDNDRTPHATIVRMTIESDAAAQAMGKVKGTYVTIEAPALRERNQQVLEDLTQTLAAEISAFCQRLGVPPQGGVLIVGLGNWNATPDALGPRVVQEVLVTRHLHAMTPPEVRGGMRPVSALSPGVLGLTGIETGEIVQGVVEKTQPACVVCIDALAARSVERLATTIQIADTGIHPGSGVGNRRLGITPATLGRPVLVIGVPTVVHATTIVLDALDALAGQFRPFPPPAPVAPFPAAPGDGQRWIDAQRARQDPLGLPRDPAQKQALIEHLLRPYMGELIVTPKEIDVLIADVAKVISGALNAALHPSIDLDNVLAYLRR
ncbi:MAG TPA: GPR endopeptidase [Limnochordia bacterium]